MINSILPAIIGQLQPSGGFVLPTPTSDFDPAFGCYSDAGITPSTDNTLLYQWDDNGTLGNTGEQTSSSRRPLWRADGGALRNNKPYVDFVSLDYMQIIDSSFDYRDSAMTFYLVVDDADGNYNTMLMKGSDWNWDDGFIIYGDSSNNFVTSVNEWTAGRITNTDGSSGYEVRAFRFNQSFSDPQNNNRVNTNADDTGTTYSSVDTPIKNALIGASWDSSGTGPTLYADVKMYRMLIYNEYHDDTKYGEIIDYLMTEYAI